MERLMKWETSVSLTYFKYKTISRIIQFFVEDFVETLCDSEQTLFSDFVEICFMIKSFCLK